MHLGSLAGPVSSLGAPHHEAQEPEAELVADSRQSLVPDPSCRPAAVALVVRLANRARDSGGLLRKFLLLMLQLRLRRDAEMLPASGSTENLRESVAGPRLNSDGR